MEDDLVEECLCFLECRRRDVDGDFLLTEERGEEQVGCEVKREDLEVRCLLEGVEVEVGDEVSVEVKLVAAAMACNHERFLELCQELIVL